MESRSFVPAVRSVFAWLALVAALVVSLLFLNGAVFSAWMSGGPPNPYPQGWAMRSLGQLSWAASAAIGGWAVFRILRDAPVLRRATIVLAVLAGALAVFPSTNQFLQIDRCLDSGGRWNYEGLQCER